MRNNMAFGVLLIITAATAGLTIFYNLYFREAFPIIINYNFPAVHRAGEFACASSNNESDLESELIDEYVIFENEEEYDEFYEGDGGDGEEWVTSVEFPLDINTATVDELKFIPRVGDVTAQRIVQYREHIGGYTSLDQLMEIKGIAEASFDRIAPYLYIKSE